MVSLYERGSEAVVARVASQNPQELAVTVISVEEQLTGWYTLLRRAKRPGQLAAVYQRLANTVSFLGSLQILSFTELAIARYEALRRLNLNIGAMDLRIAAIVLEVGGTLITRNTRDFARVPGLVFADWS